MQRAYLPCGLKRQAREDLVMPTAKVKQAFSSPVSSRVNNGADRMSLHLLLLRMLKESLVSRPFKKSTFYQGLLCGENQLRGVGN